ncbi:MAG: copper amine oxidase N-terminal domain-containing protein [Clostridia bacterium]|nr:copper amine oxidase N-terminal domain-containing protein [Clostridia bacterium]
MCVNNEKIEFDVNPVIEDGRTLVPMRFIFEAIGAEVEWVKETKTAVAVKGEIKLEITANSNQMLKNGEVIALDVPAKIVEGRTLVPVRAVSEGLGAKVEWDKENFKVIITTDESASKTYKQTELSAADMEVLKSLYGDIRYAFEQQYLPFYVNELTKAGVDWQAIFTSKEPKIEELVKAIWNDLICEFVATIQIESQYEYEFLVDVISDEEIISAYNNILKQAELSAEYIFETKYTKTPAGKDVFLLTFYKTDTKLACKYIAIVPYANEARCFTAESDLMLEEMGIQNYFLCEVKGESRTNFGLIGNSESDFLKGIDTIE